MFVKNLKNEEYTLLGINLEANELIPLKDIGSAEQIMRGTDALLNAINAAEIEIQYSDGTVLLDTLKLINIFQGNVTEVEVSNLSEIDIGDIAISSSDIRGNDFYYNSVYKILAKGESLDVEFKGYLKSASLIVEEGEVEVQIIKPKMNKVKIKDFNTYDIDTDFKIKDPIIRINAIKKSQITVYVDGLYNDETKTKSKDQYLNEIYGEDLPTPTVPDEKVKLFHINLLEEDLSTGSVVDEISHNPGIIKEPIIGNVFNKKSVINFKNIFNLTEHDSFTQSFWFKPNDLAYSRYIAYKSGIFYIYQSRTTLYANYDNRTIKVADLEVDKWYNLIATYSKDTEVLNYYVNGVFSATHGRKPTFSNRTTDFLVGNLSNSSNNYGFEGQMGIISSFNYHMSSGMVQYIFKKENPLEQLNTNLVSKVNMRYFDVSKRGYNAPDSKEEFDILEKEYTTSTNLLHQEYLTRINYMDSTLVDVSNREFYMSIGTGLYLAEEEGYYKFQIQGDDSLEITIDDRMVVSNYGLNSYTSEAVQGEIYLKEGYHDFKFRHYQLKGASTFYAYEWDYQINDWGNVVLYQKDAEDEEATVEDISKIIEIKDWICNVPIITDSNVYEQKESDAIKYFEFNDYGALKLDLTDIPLYENNTFTVSFAYYPDEDKEHFIFGYGNSKDWGDWLLLRSVDRNKLELTFCGKSKKGSGKLAKDEYFKIDIVSNGITIEVYVDGDSYLELEYKEDEYFRGNEFWFNRLSSGGSWGWSKSKFRINDFVWYSTTKNKETIQANYTDFANKYK